MSVSDETEMEVLTCENCGKKLTLGRMLALENPFQKTKFFCTKKCKVHFIESMKSTTKNNEQEKPVKSPDNHDNKKTKNSIEKDPYDIFTFLQVAPIEYIEALNLEKLKRMILYSRELKGEFSTIDEISEIYGYSNIEIENSLHSLAEKEHIELAKDDENNLRLICTDKGLDLLINNKDDMNGRK